MFQERHDHKLETRYRNNVSRSQNDKFLQTLHVTINRLSIGLFKGTLNI